MIDYIFECFLNEKPTKENLSKLMKKLKEHKYEYKNNFKIFPKKGKSIDIDNPLKKKGSLQDLSEETENIEKGMIRIPIECKKEKIRFDREIHYLSLFPPQDPSHPEIHLWTLHTNTLYIENETFNHLKFIKDISNALPVRLGWGTPHDAIGKVGNVKEVEWNGFIPWILLFKEEYLKKYKPRLNKAKKKFNNAKSFGAEIQNKEAVFYRNSLNTLENKKTIKKGVKDWEKELDIFRDEEGYAYTPLLKLD